MSHPRHLWPQSDVSFENEASGNDKEDQLAGSKHFVFLGKSRVCKQGSLNAAFLAWEQAYRVTVALAVGG